MLVYHLFYLITSVIATISNQKLYEHKGKPDSCNSLNEYLQQRNYSDFTNLETYPLKNYRIKYETKGENFGYGSKHWKTRGWIYCKRVPYKGSTKADRDAYQRYKALAKPERRGRFMCINGKWDADWRDVENPKKWGVMVCPNRDIPGQWAEVYPPPCVDKSTEAIEANKLDPKITYIVDQKTGIDSFSLGYGFTEEKPFKTIGKAISAIKKHCVIVNSIILVKNGTYSNRWFGKGAPDTGFKNLYSALAIVDLQNVKLTNFNENHKPKILFDGQTGIYIARSKNIEISGFEITQGLDDQTNHRDYYQEALADRMIKHHFFNGKGISAQNVTNFIFKNNSVHHCSAAGLRMHNCESILVENNKIYNNTWWNSDGMSGITLAVPQDLNVINDDVIYNPIYDIENLNEVTNTSSNPNLKFFIRNNEIFGNINKIPFFSHNYNNPQYRVVLQNCQKFIENIDFAVLMRYDIMDRTSENLCRTSL